MSSSSGFAKVQSDDRELNQVQSNITLALKPFQDNKTLHGVLLNGITLAIGSNVINTGINRPVIGYWITSQASGANIYNAPFSGPNLTLISDAVALINIYVF